MINLEISSKVRNLYLALCPLSSAKCDTFSEIDYKIKRAVELGKSVEKRSNGNYVVGYFHLRFLINGKGKVIDMWKKGADGKCIIVSEKLKRRHYMIVHKDELLV
jgi:hypothetical protein